MRFCTLSTSIFGNTVSYRDLEEIMAERGVQVDHATLNRWVLKHAPIVGARAQSKKRPTQSSWRMDETYICVCGKWMYLYRAVDKAGNTLDFMLTERRNRPAATRFFAKALSSNGTRRIADRKTPRVRSHPLEDARP